MPEGTGRLLQWGPITDFSLMIGLNIFANGGRQIHTSHCGSFLCNLNFFLLYRPVDRLYMILTAAEGSKHCQPSSTSFGLVDRFKGNYSATGRANCSSGRGKSITPLQTVRLPIIAAIMHHLAV